MNFQAFFTKENLDVYDVDGFVKATEPVHLTRQGIANNDFAHTHKFKGLCVADTVISEGDLLVSENNEKYLVTAMRKVQFMNTIQCNAWLCDYECSISRLVNRYVGTNKVGKEEVVVKENIPCVQKDTNAKMQLFDAGLLEGTIKLLYCQNVYDIKLTDRIVLNEKSYQINSIDTTIHNILCLQLAEDKRK